MRNDSKIPETVLENFAVCNMGIVRQGVLESLRNFQVLMRKGSDVRSLIVFECLGSTFWEEK